MRFANGKQFLEMPRKAISLIGMSGIGKTTLAAKLPRSSWFHYSGDYRIGTRYMDEVIADNLKSEAMQNPFLANLLRRDAIHITSNISMSDLSPLSTYLGKLGDSGKGGLALDEFRLRQDQHRIAEIKAMSDLPYFIKRAKRVYDYPHFLNDAGGSVVEVIDFDDPNDPTLTALTENTLLLYIRATDEDAQLLRERAARDPKPLYYCDAFLDENLPRYLSEQGVRSTETIEPDDFVRWAFPHLVAHRRARYEQLGSYGYAVTPAQLFAVRDEAEFIALVASAIDKAAC